jgi:hypothetical protein
MQGGANASTLSVDVQPGTCVIAGTDQVRQGKYVCRNNAVANVVLSPRPAAGSARIDVVYAQVSDSAAGVSGASDSWILGVVTGTPTTGTPTVPALPTSSLALTQVRVQGGTGATIGSVSGDAVTDVRVRARTVMPLRAWGPQFLSATGTAATVTGAINLVQLTVGPYPCAWTAQVVYHCVGIAGGGQALTLQLVKLVPAPLTVLSTGSINLGAGQGVATNAYAWQQADGSAVTFSGQGNTVAGGSGTVYATADLHRLTALVFFQP